MKAIQETKPDFGRCLERTEAWFAHERLDRPPVRFAEHNAEYSGGPALTGRTWPDLRARWFDAEFQVDCFLDSIRGKRFCGETFPVFWLNLGPNVYAAFHGAELDYGEVTSWVRRCVHERGDLERLQFSRDNVYFRKIEELTRVGLQKCAGQFMVGYTDLHGSLDCAAAWRAPQQLCLDLADDPGLVHALVNRADEHFLPTLRSEVRHMTHNIFHLDGKGMLRHLDRILAIPEIQAIQWVHGVGDDAPIMQWLPVIKKIQAAQGRVGGSPASRVGTVHRRHRSAGPLPLHRRARTPPARHPETLGERVAGGLCSERTSMTGIGRR